MYRLTVDGVETYMVVTRNVFSHRLTVHRKYDLKVKGSVFPHVPPVLSGGGERLLLQLHVWGGLARTR